MSIYYSLNCSLPSIPEPLTYNWHIIDDSFSKATSNFLRDNWVLFSIDYSIATIDNIDMVGMGKAMRKLLNDPNVVIGYRYHIGEEKIDCILTTKDVDGFLTLVELSR